MILKSKYQKGIFFILIIFLFFVLFRYFQKNSIFFMPREYKLIKDMVNKIALRNDLGEQDIGFTITAGGHAEYLGKELGICKEENCYFLRNLNPFNKKYNNQIKQVLNQSYIFNGLEAYAWRNGVVEIAHSNFFFFGLKKEYFSCLIAHELAHILENHRHKRQIEFQKKLNSLESRSSLSESDLENLQSQVDRNLEIKADQFGAMMVFNSGYDKYTCLKALRSFGVREAFEVETLKDSTHPGFIEREKALRKYLDTLKKDKNINSISSKKWRWIYDREKNILTFRYL